MNTVQGNPPTTRIAVVTAVISAYVIAIAAELVLNLFLWFVASLTSSHVPGSWLDTFAWIGPPTLALSTAGFVYKRENKEHTSLMTRFGVNPKWENLILGSAIVIALPIVTTIMWSAVF